MIIYMSYSEGGMWMQVNSYLQRQLSDAPAFKQATADAKFCQGAALSEMKAGLIRWAGYWLKALKACPEFKYSLASKDNPTG